MRGIAGLVGVESTSLEESEPLPAGHSPADDGGAGGILETIIQRRQRLRAATPAVSANRIRWSAKAGFLGSSDPCMYDPKAL